MITIVCENFQILGLSVGEWWINVHPDHRYLLGRKSSDMPSASLLHSLQQENTFMKSITEEKKMLIQSKKIHTKKDI